MCTIISKVVSDKPHMVWTVLLLPRLVKVVCLVVSVNSCSLTLPIVKITLIGSDVLWVLAQLVVEQ